MTVSPQRLGALLCLASAVCFGAMAVFGKLAYDAGVGVTTLLCVRFVLAALALWGAVLATGQVPRVRRETLLAALALGGVGYALQSGLFFAALERMDASLLALLLYTYPAMVTAAAIVLGRERPSRLRTGALVVASCGLVLVLAGAADGALDPLATVLGLGAAVTYTTYILVSDAATGDLEPLPLAALVSTGAAVTFALAAAGTGSLELGFAGDGWLWLGLIALVSTVGAIVLFFAGMRRVGPSTAAILSTLEPVVTVVLAYVAFGEGLNAVQLAGGALVLGAVVALNRPMSRLPARRAALAQR
jgi:drug/metabolite transporter (DMT)-like permease